GRVELIALDHFARGDEEGRGGDLDAIVTGRARSGALPAQVDVGRAARADGNLLQIVRLHGRGHVEQPLATLDRARLIEVNVIAVVQSSVIATACSRVNRAGGDAYVFRIVLAHAKACVGLGRKVVARQLRLDDIARAFGLLVGADVD